MHNQLDLTSFDFSLLPPSILGHLTFKPGKPTQPPLKAGLHSLGIAQERDTMLFVPEGLDTSKPVPFLVMFHGAGGSAGRVLPIFQEQAQKHQFLLMVPQSIYQTWDLTIGGNGPDLDRLEQALTKVNTYINLIIC